MAELEPIIRSSRVVGWRHAVAPVLPESVWSIPRIRVDEDVKLRGVVKAARRVNEQIENGTARMPREPGRELADSLRALDAKTP